MRATPDIEDARWVDAGPSSLARKLGAGFVQAFVLPRTVLARRELLVAGVRRELAARYSGTWLGRAWTLATPLVLFCVYYFLFTRIFGFRLGDLPDSQRAALGVWMFLGLVAWTGFAEGVARASTVLVENGTLIKKLAFPAELLPLECVLASALVQCLGFGVFALVASFAGLWPPPGIALAWCPVILGLQLVFAYGLALALSAATVFVRDVAAGLGLVLTLWMLATPIFWIPAREMLPGIDEWLPWLELNPLHSLAYAWRAVWMSNEPALVFQSSIARELAHFAPWALASYFFGATLFACTKRRFADEV
ncbi:MAG: ABC transporter permease [Planctomycetes bacterium]|nr:ABC transporter permease [Planctomycetota bacterium]